MNMGWVPRIGQVVSRACGDEQVIRGVADNGRSIDVECIKPDVEGLYKVGDREWNSSERYSLERDQQ